MFTENVLKQSILHVRNSKVILQLRKKKTQDNVQLFLNAREEKLSIMTTKKKQIT